MHMGDLVSQNSDHHDSGGESLGKYTVYEVEYREQFGDPIIELYCRDAQDRAVTIEVEGQEPYFYVRTSALGTGKHRTAMSNHQHVERLEDGHESIEGHELTRIYAKLPKLVGGDEDSLRALFDQTWEADIFFSNRFLIDNDVYTNVLVDESDTWTGSSVEGDFRVHVEDLDTAEADSKDLNPRTCTVDIEVEAPEFPKPHEAKYPVTAITAHDSYTDEYHLWALTDPRWPSTEEIENRLQDETPGVSVLKTHLHDDESDMLAQFNEWVAEHRFDVFTGWSSNDFDYPYLINRCQSENVINYRDWSPRGEVWDSRFAPRVKGVTMLDMMEAYKKTQFQNPMGGWNLENISEKETTLPKLDVRDDLDELRREDPVTFLRYNIRDVRSVIAIDENVGVMDMFDDLRVLTGATYGDCHNNIDLLDVHILREAREAGKALPSSTEPDEGWYHGAHVFQSTSGRHEHVVYPDFSSLYPSMIQTCNMSPETLIGDEGDLQASEYDESDCVRSYFDDRPVKHIDAGDEKSRYTGGYYKAVVRHNADGSSETVWSDDPEHTELHYLKPKVKQGFIRQIVDDLRDLKDEYDGTSLYDAVKRVVNSIYGVFGDSDSYGTGYRLFDHRLAESITLGGRRVLLDTTDEFIDRVNAYKNEHGHVGQDAYLVGGDTDSVQTSVTWAPGPETSLEASQEAAISINEWWDVRAPELFGCKAAEHMIEIEIESYSRYLFVPESTDGTGVKKRYVQKIDWDEGTWIDEPEVKAKGFELARSDTAVVTSNVQRRVFDTILTTEDLEAARQSIYDIVKDESDAILNRETPLSEVAVAKGMNDPPESYGSASRTPQPHYRGAKYANKHVEGEHITAGTKVKLLYVNDVHGLPKTYTADTKEDGDRVDAVAVEDIDNIADIVDVDREKMVEKTIEAPLRSTFRAFEGWSLRDAQADTDQGRLENFM